MPTAPANTAAAPRSTFISICSVSIAFIARAHSPEEVSTPLGGKFAWMANFAHFRSIFDESDQRIGEGLDIVLIAAGDNISVGNRRLVDHIRACVPEVGA